VRKFDLTHACTWFSRLTNGNQIINTSFYTNYFSYNQQRPFINKNVHRKSQNPRLSTSPGLRGWKIIYDPFSYQSYIPNVQQQKKNVIKIGQVVSEERDHCKLCDTRFSYTRRLLYILFHSNTYNYLLLICSCVCTIHSLLILLYCQRPNGACKKCILCAPVNHVKRHRNRLKYGVARTHSVNNNIYIILLFFV